MIVDQYGREIKQDRTAEIQAKFDLAQTTAHNRRHWANADALAARAAMSPAIRALVRKRSRYEFDNNSWYSGMLRTASNHIVGTGPRLQVLSQNTEANARLEAAWLNWSRSVMLAETIRMMLETYWKDGELYVMRTNRPRLWPISLDIRVYESEQCSRPWIGASIHDPYTDDGIRIDENTNEVEYHIYDHHPGDVAFTPSLSGEWYPASEIAHLFRKERPGQAHGIPRATCSLSTLPVMRRQEMATLLASETAASFATYLKSTSSALDPKASPADFAEIEIAYNMLTTLPAGWDIDQVDGKHPGPQYEMFQRQALMSFGRCMNMPYALCAGTSKDSNFSSLKGDVKNIWQPEVTVEQDRLELRVVEKVWGWFLDAAVYVPGLLDGLPPTHNIAHQWHWPPLPNLDEVDSATASKIRLESGQSVPSTEYMAQGKDYETEMAKGANDYGVSVDELKKAIFNQTFKLQPVVPGANAGFTADADSEPSAGGEYTELGQRAYNNNQKRIRKVLDSLIAGEISTGRARLDLQSIGLSAESVQAYIDDALDGEVSPELEVAQ